MNDSDGGEESATLQVTQDYPAGEPFLGPFRHWNVTCYGYNPIWLFIVCHDSTSIVR